jgi:beta-lactamase class D
VTARVSRAARLAIAGAALASLLAPRAPLGAQTVYHPVREHAEWRAAFDSAGVRGTFVLRRLGGGDGGTSQPDDVFDAARARRRYLPASTFKVPNSLIALELGVVRDERERFAVTWPRQPVESWNRPHTFATALKHSVVPVYQIVARRVGEARYRRWLARLDYGNRDPGGGVDRFWLDGDLRISALEQVAFLERLAARRLPLSERSQRIVRDMLVREANDCYVLRAKTGLVGVSARSLSPEEGVGWYVGWVETDSASWAFALNIDVRKDGDSAARQRVAREILGKAGVLATGC